MAWTLQDCIGVLKQEYPDFYPYAFVEHKGVYIFNLIAKGERPENAISDMHVVDPKQEAVSGSISIMELLEDEEFRRKWQHANLVSHHLEPVKHSALSGRGFFSETGSEENDNRHGYAVRRTGSQNISNGTEKPDFLMHHGIPNQKWGVRNGPPYPLSADKHRAVVSNVDQSGKTIRSEDKNASDSKKKAAAGDSADGRMGNPYISIALNLATHVLLKKVVYPYVADKFIKEPLQKSWNKKNRETSRKLISDIADLDKEYSQDNPPKMIRGKHTPEDDMAAVNPKYGKGQTPGTSNNCVLCSCTYDLRRRGYDVTALSSSTGNYSDKILKSLYENPKIEKARALTFDMMFNGFAKKYPEGARGEIHLLGLFGGGGHSMAWEIVGGKFKLVDAQRNVEMTPKDLNRLGFSPLNKENAICRTDNLSVKMDNIQLTSAEFKSGWKKLLKQNTQKDRAT